MQERMSKNHPADTVKESDTLPTVAKLQSINRYFFPTSLTAIKYQELMALLQRLRHS